MGITLQRPIAVTGILQAGGRGLRLMPITETLPKPLIPVAGMPMIERMARRFLASGIAEIDVITGWRGDQIRDHLQGLPDLPVRFRFHPEPSPLGNFGAMAKFGGLQQTFLFAFADLATEIDLAKLLAVHHAAGADVTLASHQEQYQVSLGEIVSNGSRVTGYREKPVKSFTICSGVAAIDPRALAVLDRDVSCGISDFLNQAVAAGLHVEHWSHGAAFFDVNDAQKLAAANAFFA